MDHNTAYERMSLQVYDENPNDVHNLCQVARAADYPKAAAIFDNAIKEGDGSESIDNLTEAHKEELLVLVGQLRKRLLRKRLRKQ